MATQYKGRARFDRVRADWPEEARRANNQTGLSGRNVSLPPQPSPLNQNFAKNVDKVPQWNCKHASKSELHLQRTHSSQEGLPPRLCPGKDRPIDFSYVILWCPSFASPVSDLGRLGSPILTSPLGQPEASTAARAVRGHAIGRRNTVVAGASCPPEENDFQEARWPNSPASCISGEIWLYKALPSVPT